MAESLKKFGVDGKKRFTLKYTDGRIESFGTCDDKEDERFNIVKGEFLNEVAYFLVQYQHHDTDYSQPEQQRELLPTGTLVANGYYEREWDEFVSPMEWLKQTK